MEIPSPEALEQHGIPARDIFPNRQELADQYNKLIDNGELALTPTDSKHSHATVATWGLKIGIRL